MQSILVYIIVAVALFGAVRYGYRKIKALKNRKEGNACSDCPLKKNCTKNLTGQKEGAECCK